MVAPGDRGPLRGSRPVHRPLPALPRPRLDRPHALRPQPPTGRPQVRRDGGARRRRRPRVLVGVRRRRRGPRPARRAAGLGRGARRGPRDAPGLRGAGLGAARLDVGTLVGGRAPGGLPGPRPVPRQLPRALARRGSGGLRRRSRREAVLPAARRCSAAADGRPPVESPPPALPGPGRLRPRHVPAIRARRGLHRSPVAGGVQRHLPAVRPVADGDRRHALAGMARRGPGVESAGVPTGPTTVGPFPVGPLVRRARGRRHLRPPRRRGARDARLHPYRTAPLEARAAVGAGEGARPAERFGRTALGRGYRRRRGPGTGERRPGHLRGTGRSDEGPRPAPYPRRGRGRALRNSCPGRHSGLLHPDQPRRLDGRLPVHRRRGRDPGPASPVSTTSR